MQHGESSAVLGEVEHVRAKGRSYGVASLFDSQARNEKNVK
jgi:hypothetical protein